MTDKWTRREMRPRPGLVELAKAVIEQWKADGMPAVDKAAIEAWKGIVRAFDGMPALA